MSNVIETLTTAGKRTRIHNDQIVIKLPQTAAALVRDIATVDQVSTSQVVRVAIAEYLERRGYGK